MGRGSSGVSRIGGGGVNPANISNIRNMVSIIGDNEGGKRAEALEVLSVSQDMLKMYGNSVQVADFQTATIGGKDAGTIAYYDGTNIAFNEKYLDAQALSRAYADAVSSGYHPSNGSMTPIQAVAAHEYGHHLTKVAGQRLGLSLDAAADRIVNEARRQTSHRGVVQMAAKISKYATSSNAEAIAEAMSDVYCNGNRARQESRAIVGVLNRYLV